MARHDSIPLNPLLEVLIQASLAATFTAILSAFGNFRIPELTVCHEHAAHLVVLVVIQGLVPLLLSMVPTATSGRCLRGLLVFPEVGCHPEFYYACQSLFPLISLSAQAAKMAQRQWLIKKKSLFLSVLKSEGSKSKSTSK